MMTAKSSDTALYVAKMNGKQVYELVENYLAETDENFYVTNKYEYPMNHFLYFLYFFGVNFCLAFIFAMVILFSRLAFNSSLVSSSNGSPENIRPS